MKIFIVDTEVFAYDFLADFKDMETGEHYSFWNDGDAIYEMLRTDDAVFGTFNGKHYDKYVLGAMTEYNDSRVVKDVNDWIILGGKNGWEYPERNIASFWFPMFDLMDDCQQGLSLKSIEAHLGMDIRETTVPFDIDRPLTEAEKEEVEFYCRHDVEATANLFKLRTGYLENKIKLGQESGIDAVKAMSMTNAKLTAAFLGAVRQEHDDERNYQYPKKLLRQYIPQEVFDFYDRLHDDSIPDDVVFSGKLKLMVGDCPCVLGSGGIHGAIPCYREEATENRTIRNKDVASYYPHQMTLNGYCSRNIPSPEMYASTIERRVKAKKSGDKATANALKLVLNTTYGAMLNQYNDLFDPLMGRSVCISGQLQLLELAEHLVQDCPTLKIIQLNTDGIMVSLDNSDEPKYQEITQEWQDRTGFELEEDFIKMICQKDVNNYVEVPMDGEPKIKGGYLVRGIAPAGAFNINSNATIVAKALKDYLASGIPVEKTIGECNNVLDFQLVAKASHKYSGTFHEIDGIGIEVQRVNRVYATTNEKYGTLYKIHAERGNKCKMPGLPDHCIVDNDNSMGIDSIDKQWYIELAIKEVNDFYGFEKLGINENMEVIEMAPRTKTAEVVEEKVDYSTMSVWRKLQIARLKFLEAGVDKSGRHPKLEFKYFELGDIVPSATKIFTEVGLLMVPTIAGDQALATVINADNSSEFVQFTLPYTPIPVIVSNSGNAVTNPMQATGSSITYIRRYLWMVVLDIVEYDAIDGGAFDNAESETPAPAKKAPATTEQRAEIKKEITGGTKSKASPEKIKELKNLLRQLMEIDPENESYVQETALRTNNFRITEEECASEIEAASQKLNAGKEEG